MAIVGVDIGTQSLKAVVVSDRLELLGEAARGYGVDHPQPGWAEQDPRSWERALAPAIGDALAAAGIAPDGIAALGIAGQLDGCVPTDRDGAPLGPCLIWMDRRASTEMPALPDDARTRTGVIADPGHMAGKIRWLERHRPGAARYHQPVSYLVARLTGAHVFDHGLASTTMLYDLARRDYDDELLARFDIDRARLPAIAGATELVGSLTESGATLAGLPVGTPVCTGTGDDFATPLGAGLVGPGAVACVLGTAEVVGALHPTAVIDPGALVETHAYPGDCYFVENPGWLAGGAIEWLAGITGRAAAELDDAAAEVASGADGLSFVPALSGAMAPRWIASARGAFHGLTPAHGVGHLARAVMEGCAFAMRDVVDRLGELGVETSSILLAGGGARSRVWPQMRADLTGLPVELAARADACPIGAAALAAVGVGIQPSLADCAPLLAGNRRRVDPDPTSRPALDAAYAAYRSLFEALTPLWT